MPDLLPYLLVSAVCLASVLAWGIVLHRAALGRPHLLAPSTGMSPTIPIGTVVLATLCLALFLSGPLLELLGQFLHWPPPEPRQPTLADVQLIFVFDIILAAALVASVVIQQVPLTLAGFRADQPLRRCRDAFIGFLLAIGPVFVVLVISDVIGLRGADPEHEMLKMLAGDGTVWNWVWVSLTAVVAAPLAEELLFRVILQGWLERFVPAAVAIGLSSLLFCIVHRFPDSLALLPLALMLGYVQYRRQSYLTVVAIHATFNAFNLLLTAVSSSR